MCAIPNSVIHIDTFTRLFDGLLIGWNDLTQLVRGVEHNSALVAFDFDERDEGVKAMSRHMNKGARRNRRNAGICGQAPSDYPKMAEYLVELGVHWISVMPDTLLKFMPVVLAVEKRMGVRPAATTALEDRREPTHFSIHGAPGLDRRRGRRRRGR